MPENATAKAILYLLIGIAALVVWEIVASLVFCFRTHITLSNTAYLTYGYYWWNNPNVGGWPADSYARVQAALQLASLVATGLLAVAVIGIIVSVKGAPARYIHGNAKWAKERDLVKKHMREAGQGIILGMFGGKLISFGTDENVAAFAPPRSGKTTGLAITNALLYRGSVFVFDIRDAIRQATAGARASAGQKVVVFDPLNPSGMTHRYNPLDYIRRGTPDAFTDMMGIANMLIPDGGGGDQADFWNPAARQGFVAVGLLLSETDGAKFSIGEIVRTLCREDSADHIRKMIKAREKAGNPYSKGAMAMILDYLNVPEVTRSNIRKTITTKIGSWMNPRIDAATEVSDFDLTKLRQQLMAIYVCINPDDLRQVHVLVSLMVQQIIALSMRRDAVATPPHKHRLLMILDEFPQLGLMPALRDSMAFLGGFGVRTLLIMQSQSQLESVYGRAGAASILQNAPTQVYFGTSDYTLAETVTKKVGFYTEWQVSSSQRGFGGRSTSKTPVKAALILPQNVMDMDDEREIITRIGAPAIDAVKIRSWRDLPFKNLTTIDPPPVPIVDLKFGSAGPKKDAAGGVGSPAPDQVRDSIRRPSPPQARGPKPAEPAAKPKQPSLFDTKSGSKLLEDIAGQPDVDLSKFKGDPEGAADHLKKVIEKARTAGRDKSGKAA